MRRSPRALSGASLERDEIRLVAEFIVLPGASHSINWEQPEAFNQMVLEFIGAH